MSITVRAPAKINLLLGVGPVREDGYHPLDTVYQAISLYDDVTVTDADDWAVTVEAIDAAVDLADVPLDATNIAIRAGLLLTAHHGIDRAAAIAIRKGIPVAGGMAGGSADAAATLVALDRLWDLQTPDEDLLRIAGELGSDVPFALIGGTAHGTGRGELVEPVVDPGTWWWVVVPNAEGVSTAAVYRAYDELGVIVMPNRSVPLISALGSGDPAAVGLALCNDLEATTLRLRPDLEATARAVADAGATPLLSGSGPTYLGLVADQVEAHLAREALLAAGHRDVLIATGPVAGAHVVTYV